MNITDSITFLFQNISFFALALLGIGFIIGFHEFGHFLFCKIFNVKTPSFSIGMGPRILKKKIGETEFVLSAIPLGGYVEIAGSAEVGQGDQKEAHATDERSLNAKPYYQKMLIVAGGILFNMIFAYIILSGLYFTGAPWNPLMADGNIPPRIGHVFKNSPAEKAGVKSNDIILEINNTPVRNNIKTLIETIIKNPNQKVTLTIERNNQEKQIPVTLGSNPIAEKSKKKVGYLGADFIIKPHSLFESIKKGFYTGNTIFLKTITEFKKMFSKREFKHVGGPLLIISETIRQAQRGLKILLLFLVFISINLAVLNILPLPILDGGQALFYTIEAIIRRPLPERIKEYIHYISWIGVILLFIYLSYQDIQKIIFGIK